MNMVELIPEGLLPFFIFFSRIMDVSLGTLRIMFVSRGIKGKATLLGFIEVLIWIIVVAQIFQNLDNWLFYIAYAGGFATGTFVGMYIEEKLQVGTQIFRMIVPEKNAGLLHRLREAGFRVTHLDGEGKYGTVKVIFTITRRKRWKELAKLLDKYAPESFYSIEDVRQMSDEQGRVLHPENSNFSQWLRLKKGI